MKPWVGGTISSRDSSFDLTYRQEKRKLNSESVHLNHPVKRVTLASKKMHIEDPNKGSECIFGIQRMELLIKKANEQLSSKVPLFHNPGTYSATGIEEFIDS